MPDDYGPGRAEEAYGYLRGDYVTGFELGNAFPGGFYPDISLDFGNFAYGPPVGLAPPTIFPEVSYQQPPGAPSVPYAADPGDEALVPSEHVIDPEEAPEYTVSEEDPVWIENPFPNPFENTRETDWDAVYDEYVILNPPTTAPEVNVPIDWGEIAGDIIGGIWGPSDSTMGQAPWNPNMAVAVPAGVGAPPGMRATPPARVTIDTRTGQVVPCRRRRRRRLLTSSDLADLASLRAIVGGGAAMNAAVVKAVRR